MVIHNYLGAIFYKSKEGKRESVRVTKIINEKQVIVTNTIEPKEKNKIFISELFDDYTLLTPDGYIHFSIVEINGLNDVVVTMITDIESAEPYCVCRQNINNIFEEYVNPTRKDGVICSGLSVSKDTIPAGLSILQVLAGDKLIRSTCVAIYNTDKLDDIINNIKTDPYDKVLDIIFNIKIESCPVQFIRKIMKDKTEYAGCNRTLKGLLESQLFMYDVHKGFGLGVVDTISIDDSDIVHGDLDIAAQINPKKIVKIESELGTRFINPIVKRYTKDVDLSMIQNKHLICDCNDNIFMITFDSEYNPNKYSSTETPEDRLKNIMK